MTGLKRSELKEGQKYWDPLSEKLVLVTQEETEDRHPQAVLWDGKTYCKMTPYDYQLEEIPVEAVGEYGPNMTTT